MADSDALQLIAEEFVRSLPERMDGVDAAYLALKQDSSNSDSMNDLYHKVHNLAGSSGTFGFKQFSDLARTILNILEPAIKGEVQLDDQIVNSVGPQLAELAKEAATPVQIEDWL